MRLIICPRQLQEKQTRFNLISKKHMEAEFKPYASIENHYRDKYINFMKKKYPQAFQGKWMVQEKIHGANFSVVFYEGGLKYGRRNGFLTDLIPYKLTQEQLLGYDKLFSQKFYNAHLLFKKRHNQLAPVFPQLKEQFPSLVSINIYGQLFGGKFEGHLNKDFKAVQQEIEYSPELEYMIFDMMLTTEKESFFVKPQSIQKMVGGALKMVPVLFVGSYEEAMDFNTKFDSTIPEVLGHPKKEKNICQGVVIRPIVQSPIEDRIIIKKKNAEFNEVASKPKEKKKVPTKLSEEEEALLEAIGAYNTKIRVASVLSKKDTKDLNEISKLMIEDMWTDYKKDGLEVKGEQSKQFVNTLKKQVIETIKQYNKGNKE